MKTIILNRIEELRKFHGGFHYGGWRWKGIKVNDIHISELDRKSLKKLDNEKLLFLFEYITRQANKQG
jgi:hypothetical protein